MPARKSAAWPLNLSILWIIAFPGIPTGRRTMGGKNPERPARVQPLPRPSRHMGSIGAGSPGEQSRHRKKPQISPLRYAPVEMTIWFENRIQRFQESSAELQIPRLLSGGQKGGGS